MSTYNSSQEKLHQEVQMPEASYHDPHQQYHYGSTDDAASAVGAAATTSRNSGAHGDYYSEKAELDEPGFDEYPEHDYDDALDGKKKKRFYRNRRFWYVCGGVTLLGVAIFVPLLLLVILPKIAQSIINHSTMSLYQLNMTDATEAGMRVSMSGGIGNAGAFSATIEFPEPIVVSWKDKTLGSMTMSSVKAAGGKATIADSTYFSISDVDAFSEFSKEMLNIKEFTWVLNSKVTIKALGQTIKNLNLNKELTMLGMNGFDQIRIDSFDLPGDAPGGDGALVRLVTSMHNPSPVGMTLGTVVLDMFYDGVYLGQVSANNSVLVGNSASPLILEGTLFRKTNQTELDKISTLMSNYLGGKVSITSAKGVSVKPDGVNPVSWLSNGLTAMTLTVPLQSTTPINLIENINIADMGMVFDTASPYNPLANSNRVSASFKLPWNITVQMQNVSNTMSIGYRGKTLADIAEPIWSPASSDLNKGIISFSLPPSRLAVKDDAHEEFGQFVADLTVKTEETFTVSGNASAISNTPVGVIKLSGVPFKSDVTMKGLDFNSVNAAVSGVDVVAGNADYITMNQQVNLPNPSSLSVTGGKVTLTVYDAPSNAYLGELVIPNLKVGPGSNPTQTQFLFHPKDTGVRDRFLTEYLKGTNFPLKVVGTEASTDVVELKKAFSLVSIGSTAPGLNPVQKLITSGSATATLGTLLGNRQSTTTINMINPLNTPIYVAGQTTQVNWNGKFFGEIKDSQGFTVGAKGSAKSPTFIIQSPSGAEFGSMLTFQFMPAYPTIAFGGADVPYDLDIMLNVRVGGPNGYPANIHYTQRVIINTKLGL
ncbi:hypothetical protein BGW41_007881 [Actinomortierella wolfii]|nr:hypothetical protein BGW41_007881 [Actinomortierella wolfii]